MPGESQNKVCSSSSTLAMEITVQTLAGCKVQVVWGGGGKGVEGVARLCHATIANEYGYARQLKLKVTTDVHLHVYTSVCVHVTRYICVYAGCVCIHAHVRYAYAYFQVQKNHRPLFWKFLQNTATCIIYNTGYNIA